MLKVVLVIGVVAVVVLGGLFALRGSARTGMPDAATLARAQQRARELKGAEKPGEE